MPSLESEAAERLPPHSFREQRLPKVRGRSREALRRYLALLFEHRRSARAESCRDAMETRGGNAKVVRLEDSPTRRRPALADVLQHLLRKR